MLPWDLSGKCEAVYLFPLGGDHQKGGVMTRDQKSEGPVATSHTGLGLVIGTGLGVGIGAVLGTALSSVALVTVGVVAGLSIGVAIGDALDKRDKAKAADTDQDQSSAPDTTDQSGPAE